MAAVQAGSAGRAAAGHAQRALLAAMGAERCPTLTILPEAASEGCGGAGGKSSDWPLQHRCGTAPHSTLGHASSRINVQLWLHMVVRASYWGECQLVTLDSKMSEVCSAACTVHAQHVRQHVSRSSMHRNGRAPATGCRPPTDVRSWCDA